VAAAIKPADIRFGHHAVMTDFYLQRFKTNGVEY
jgi:hypothetical protein